MNEEKANEARITVTTDRSSATRRKVMKDMQIIEIEITRAVSEVDMVVEILITIVVVITLLERTKRMLKVAKKL
jgi:hypothetical protein